MQKKASKIEKECTNRQKYNLSNISYENNTDYMTFHTRYSTSDSSKGKNCPKCFRVTLIFLANPSTFSRWRELHSTEEAKKLKVASHQEDPATHLREI